MIKERRNLGPARELPVGVIIPAAPEPGAPPIGSRPYLFTVGIYEDALQALPVVGHDPSHNAEDEWRPLIPSPTGSPVSTSTLTLTVFPPEVGTLISVTGRGRVRCITPSLCVTCDALCMPLMVSLAFFGWNCTSVTATSGT